MKYTRNVSYDNADGSPGLRYSVNYWDEPLSEVIRQAVIVKNLLSCMDERLTVTMNIENRDGTVVWLV